MKDKKIKLSQKASFMNFFVIIFMGLICAGFWGNHMFIIAVIFSIVEIFIIMYIILWYPCFEVNSRKIRLYNIGTIGNCMYGTKINAKSSEIKAIILNEKIFIFDHENHKLSERKISKENLLNLNICQMDIDDIENFVEDLLICGGGYVVIKKGTQVAIYDITACLNRNDKKNIEWINELYKLICIDNTLDT